MQLALVLDAQPSPMPNLPAEDLDENARLRAAVLARLQRGPATGVELGAICNRYGARLFELKRSHPWAKRRLPGKGRVYLYWLLEAR